MRALLGLPGMRSLLISQKSVRRVSAAPPGNIRRDVISQATVFVPGNGHTA